MAKKTIEINLSEIFKIQVENYWKEDVETMDLKEAVREAVTGARHHFKNEKRPWKLDAEFYAELISYNFIGISCLKLATAALADVATLEHIDGKWMFVAKKKATKRATKKKAVKKKARSK